MDNHNRNVLIAQINNQKNTLMQKEIFWNNEIFDGLIEEISKAGLDKRERHYTQLTTFKLFFEQVLSADHSCQETVSGYCLDSVASNQAMPSSNTAAYCKARHRLSEDLLKQLGEQTGHVTHDCLQSDWRWHGRAIKLVDGTTLSMPDTEENQLEYPQPNSQMPGLGFPLMRWVGLTCLGTGALLGSEVSPCVGKQTGETHLFRKLFKHLNQGDILLGDRYYCSYFILCVLQLLKIDAVFELHVSRRADFRRGKKIGKKDHRVSWPKPVKPDWMSEEVYEELMPDQIEIRELAIKKGKKQKILVTTLSDDQAYPQKEIAALYKMRWNIELDLRSIKEVMQMGILRCKSPEMVRKEVSMHVIVYNVIRYLISLSAQLYKKIPRLLSFKVALQGLNQLLRKSGKKWVLYFHGLLKVIAAHRVGHRANRIEPRCVKRRPKPYRKLREPRRLARLRIENEWA